MNELSNHDHSRFMTRTNRRVGRLASAGAKAAEEGISYGIFRQGVVMQMTWPGAPTIYYGDEAGRLRMDRSGQPPDVPVGRGKPGADRVPPLHERHPETLSGI